MPGHRIYYVPPRLVGSVRDWSGLEQKDGESWLVNHAAGMKFNAIWFSPMTVATDVKKPMHGKMLTGSYYATRDHFALDADITCGDAAKDQQHLKHFSDECRKKGIRVYADLVFNHVAADHALVKQEDDEIKALQQKHSHLERVHAANGKLIGVRYHENGQKKEFFFKFRRNEDLKLKFGGPPEDPWTDAAQVNYSSPEARRFFIDGDAGHKGYFKQVIDWHLDNGFTGFRCDAAYLIPPESWKELISYTHSRAPDAVFMAETLGGPEYKVKRIANAKIQDEDGNERPAFDLGMLGFYWWDMKSDWLPKTESPRVDGMSKFGGAGSPDTHDTETTVAGGMRRAFNKAARADEAIAAISLRDYAISVLAANSSYVQMGYEYCNEKQNSVFRGEVGPKDWENLQKRAGGTLDITARMRAINELKERLEVGNCRARITEHQPAHGDNLVKIRCEFIDVDTSKKTAEVILLVNHHPENGPVQAKDSGTLHWLEKSSGLVRMDAAPGAPAVVDDVVVFHSPIPKAPAKAPAAANDRKPPRPPRMVA